jgi:PKD repeat protein
MGKARSFAGALLGVVLVASGLTVVQATTAWAATTLVADWQLNDPAGSTVMVDGTGHHNGAISPDAAADGLTLNGSLYDWSLRCPACPPAQLPRVVQVPDSSELDIPDASVTQTIEFRFKTPKGYGNIMQKGQALDTGGQIKIENPNGFTQCVYIGANRTYVAVPSPVQLNDDKWHVFRCVHTSKQVQTWVDGVEVASKNVATGPINNAMPFVIGGKSHCDNVTITCDYYTGDIDWVRIYRGDGAPPDLPPTASFTSACGALTCTFDGSASVDPEGLALSYLWDFGDGGTSPAAVANHAFAQAGSYDVKLTVTDPGGHSGAVTHQVTVAATSAVAFRAAASSNVNTLAPTVTIPAGVQTGDALLLLASTNRDATLTTPSGWTLLGTRSDSPDITSWLFTRMAPAGAAGSHVTMSLDAYSKTSLTLLAYSGAGAVTTAASAAETEIVSQTTHASPPVLVSANGSLVVSSWVDKSGTDHTWTLPPSVTLRNANALSGAGALSVATGDSGPVSVGTWPGLAATSGVASVKEVSWSIVIPPA